MEELQDIRDAIRELSRLPFTPHTIGQIAELLRPAHERLGYLAPRVVRDLAYGLHDRHRLDVHTFAEQRGPAPVLVVVPGGGFVNGSKGTPETPYFNHVGAWGCRNGVVTVVVDYRLAPDHRWPSGAEDVAAAMEWVRTRIADFGGDPARIVLLGASAGAAHVAAFVAGQAGGNPHLPRAVAVVSGIYAPNLLAATPLERLVRLYYGDDPHEVAGRAPLAGLAAWPGPLLVTVTELESPASHQQAIQLLSARVQAQGTLPKFTVVPGHTHGSDVFSLGVDESALDLMLRELLAEVAG